MAGAAGGPSLALTLRAFPLLSGCLVVPAPPMFVGDGLGACGEVGGWAVVVGAVEDLGAQEALHFFPVSICVSDRGQVEP